MAKKESSKKPAQNEIPFEPQPGVAPKKIPVIEKAANRYITHKDARCAEREKEKGAKAVLIQLILEHKDEIGVDSNGELLYRFDTHLLSVKPGKEELKIIEVGSDEGE